MKPYKTKPSLKYRLENYIKKVKYNPVINQFVFKKETIKDENIHK